MFRSKEDTKSIIGIQGVHAILQDLSTMKQQVKAVAIGGINASNVQRVLYQSKATPKGLDGVAVVSGIIAAKDPKGSAAQLRTLMKAQVRTPLRIQRLPRRGNTYSGRITRYVIPDLKPLVLIANWRHHICSESRSFLQEGGLTAQRLPKGGITY